jgi:hypothetical protein
MTTEPHTPRRRWLKNGNPPGDFTKAAKCGAKTRRGRRAYAFRCRQRRAPMPARPRPSSVRDAGLGTAAGLAVTTLSKK